MVDDVEFRSHVIIVQTLFDTHLHQSVTPEQAIKECDKRRQKDREKEKKTRDVGKKNKRL